MLSRIIVRYASRKSFSLPRINFKYAEREVEGEEVRNMPPLYPVEHDKEYSSRGGYKSKHRKTKDDDDTGYRNLETVSESGQEVSKFTKRIKQENQLIRITRPVVERNRHFRNFDNTMDFSKKYNEKKKFNEFNLEGKYRKYNSANKIEKKSSFRPRGEMMFGIHPILHALQAQRRKIYHLYYKAGLETTNIKIKEILELAKQYKLDVSAVKSSDLKEYVGEDRVHQGICCDVSPILFEELKSESFFQESRFVHDDESIASEIVNTGFEESKEDLYQVWLYMDRIQDPMNFGAILRSAYFMGVDRVLTSKENSCRISGVVSKASAGAAELMPVYQADDIRHLLGTLASKGWNLVSTAADGTNSSASQNISLKNFAPNGNMVLAVGNEGLGISDDLQDLFTTTLTVEPGRILQPGMDSLNVSVATAVILHTITSKISLLKTENVNNR